MKNLNRFALEGFVSNVEDSAYQLGIGRNENNVTKWFRVVNYECKDWVADKDLDKRLMALATHYCGRPTESGLIFGWRRLGFTFNQAIHARAFAEKAKETVSEKCFIISLAICSKAR